MGSRNGYPGEIVVSSNNTVAAEVEVKHLHATGIFSRKPEVILSASCRAYLNGQFHADHIVRAAVG